MRIVGYSLDNNEVSMQAEESPILEAVIWERLMKTTGWKRLSVCYNRLAVAL
jgi:hypothetical protein